MSDPSIKKRNKKRKRKGKSATGELGGAALPTESPAGDLENMPKVKGQRTNKHTHTRTFLLVIEE